MKQRVYVWLLLLPVFVALHCKKQDKTAGNGPGGSVNLKDSVLVQGLNFPWEILWGPDNFIWMTERGGKISRVDPSTGAVIPLLTVPEVVSNGEGGMLGLALHPDFASAPYVFVAYDYDNGGSYTEKIVRYSFNGTTLINPVVLLNGIHGASIHNGTRLLIIGDKLFISTGDAGVGDSAQSISSINGKILRLNLDGSIPADNPFPGNPVWSYGHRNAQGLVYANGILYSSEHGPDTDDEINIIEKGRNYGWPTVRGYCDLSAEQTFCTANNVKEPITAWSPTIAPSGTDYYDKDQIPQWKNSLLVATLKNQRLMQIKLNDAHTGVAGINEFYVTTYGRMRDVCISPDGKVYICTSNGGNDKLIVIRNNN
jgi:glucose/arabinose dehydrogenase